MKLELNTSICPIVDIGTYGTNLSPDNLVERDIYNGEEALKEGRITTEEFEYLCEALCENFDFKQYLNTLGRYALGYIEDFFKDVDDNVKIKLASHEYETYSPKYYNYTNDGMGFHVELERGEVDRLGGELVENKDFLDWIHKTYKHRSGFISAMPFTKTEFAEAIKGKDVERAIAMYVSWLLEKECGEWNNPYQERLEEDILCNFGGGEFVNGSDERFNSIIRKTYA